MEKANGRPRRRRQKVGTVTSAKMDKTIIVEVVRRVPHRTYKRVIKKYAQFYAHDEKRQAHEGDVVRIEETRPLSRLKRWRLLEVVRRSTD